MEGMTCGGGQRRGEERRCVGEGKLKEKFSQSLNI